MTQTVITITEAEMVSIQQRTMQRFRLNAHQSITQLNKEIKFAK